MLESEVLPSSKRGRLLVTWQVFTGKCLLLPMQIKSAFFFQALWKQDEENQMLIVYSDGHLFRISRLLYPT